MLQISGEEFNGNIIYKFYNKCWKFKKSRIFTAEIFLGKLFSFEKIDVKIHFLFRPISMKH